MSRIDIIRKMMIGNEKLLSFLFPDAAEVQDYGKSRMDLERIENGIGALSSGEQIMCRVAMDIWGEYGNVKIFDICRRLDGRNFVRVIDALVEFRAI